MTHFVYLLECTYACVVLCEETDVYISNRVKEDTVIVIVSVIVVPHVHCENKVR